MKERLKYYLRGLGTGILVTMVLMMVSNADAAQNTVSDSDIDFWQEEQTKEESEAIETEESIPVIERESAVQTGEDFVTGDVIQKGASVETEAMTDVETEVTQTSGNTSINIEGFQTEESTLTEESASVEESDTVEQSVSESVESIADAGQQTVDTAVTIQVVKGDGSGTVARKLQNAGLIDNASEFDAYLMQHGYDKKIRIGTVKIEAGATWMEIANKLIGK